MIEGNIAEILSDSEVVINRGSDSGVKPGMEFLIFILGREIKDPVSNSVLGKLEIAKGRIKISHVQPLISKGKIQEEVVGVKYNEAGIGQWSSIISGISGYVGSAVVEIKELPKVEKTVRKESDWKLTDENKTIKVGDSVRSMN